jgi:hypothetical protein
MRHLKGRLVQSRFKTGFTAQLGFRALRMLHGATR